MYDPAKRARNILDDIRKLCLMAGVAVLSLLIAEGVCNVLIFAYHRTHPDDAELRLRQRLKYYEGFPWAEEFLRESSPFRPRWEPYVYWREQPFTGKYFNIGADGLRRTWNPPVPSPYAAKIYLFGGSTMYGIGARDDFTIPSLLSRELAAAGIPAVVTNYGQRGYTSTQEWIAFHTELKAGNVPDLVIFYDGVNDVFASAQNRVAGWTQGESSREETYRILNMNEGELLAEMRRQAARSFGIVRMANFIRKRITFLNADPSLSPRKRGDAEGGGVPRERADEKELADLYRVPDDIAEKLADDTLRHYAMNLRAIQDAANRFGFRALYYWQPMVMTKSPRTPDEEGFAHVGYYTPEFYARVYEEIRERRELFTGLDFHDIQDIFDGRRERVYLDICHLMEAGNETIAHRIFEDATRELGSIRSR